APCALPRRRPHSFPTRRSSDLTEPVPDVHRLLTEVDPSRLVSVPSLLDPHFEVALVVLIDHPEDGVNVSFNRVTACRVTRVVLSGMMESQQRCLRPRSLPDDVQMTNSQRCFIRVLSDHGSHSPPEGIDNDHVCLDLLDKFRVLRDGRLISEVQLHLLKDDVVTGVGLEVVLPRLLSHRKPCVTLTGEEQHATLGSLPTPYTRAGSHTASEIHGGEALTGVRRGEQ